ncbi:3-keto-disaccharide hydrolase [Zobellia nedashkovskayae]
MIDGDIELEVDVMMPKGSNSGLYFQSRYEVQLYDSWQVSEPSYVDMGGIYQRWDKTKEKGKEGYEGHAPQINASKSPGLWQHFRIIFHAPNFDTSGFKTKNAEFKEVWLNGVLIHENVEVSGPTRGGAADEVALAPLMIQSDHGPVVFKNFKYKLFDQTRLSFRDTKMKEFKYAGVDLPNVDSLTPIREVITDSISAAMVVGDKVTRILDYKGQLVVPKSGDYLFDFRLNQGGGLLIIEDDTLVNRDGNFVNDDEGLAKVSLEKGEAPFRLIYNKHNPWAIGFSLYAEGPGIEKNALHAPSSFNSDNGNSNGVIMLEPTNKVITQRSFMMHKGEKRTHVISVGTPGKINYAYDLATGCLLKLWSGEFLDATQMWHSRGTRQLGVAVGFVIEQSGNPDFSALSTDDAKWPSVLSEVDLQSSEGYELDENGIPHFIRKMGSRSIDDVIVPVENQRKLKRTIVFKGEGIIWHKIASGESIKKLPDGSYIINDESYFVDFSNSSLSPVIRSVDGKEEMLVKIPSGEQKIEYNIIW